jgi:uncharacterized protein
MFMVKTRLAPSPIEGLGVFADEDIAKGSIVWRFVPKFDLLIDPEDVPLLPPAVVDHLKRYAYLHDDIQKYVLCGDDARFVNHSDLPNTIGVYPPGEGTGLDIAMRDIACGEEITSDYKSFDAEFVAKMELERNMFREHDAYLF